MGKGVMSEKTKYELAPHLGFGAKVEDGIGRIYLNNLFSLTE